MFVFPLRCILLRLALGDLDNDNVATATADGYGDDDVSLYPSVSVSVCLSVHSFVSLTVKVYFFLVS